MALTKRQINRLDKIVTLLKDFQREAERVAKIAAKAGPVRRPGARTRRTAVETKRMRAEVLALRSKGVPAARLAKKFGVSTAYIYMIKD
ncbi:MAG: hypothetical protein HY245_00960 [Rhizobiales bacterium]|nr:hypothetical protein [Hyphomicrobiales bacterium]MBI3672004.1 hypothetical protein [Hyphomicrobiales bacterium]